MCQDGKVAFRKGDKLNARAGEGGMTGRREEGVYVWG